MQKQKKSFIKMFENKIKLVAVVSVIFSSSLFMVNQFLAFYQMKDKITETYISQQKQIIKDKIDNIAKEISFYQEQITDSSDNFSRLNVKKIMQDKLNYIDIDNGNYIFAITYDGIQIAHKKKERIGKNIWDLEVNGIKIVQNIIKEAKEKESGFLGYTASTKLKDEISAKKISYIRNIPEWNWVIGTGFYTKELNALVQKEMDRRLPFLFRFFIITILVIISILIFAQFLSYKLVKNFKQNLKLFISHFDNSQKKFVPFDLDEVKYQEFEKLAISSNIMDNIQKKYEKYLIKSQDEMKRKNNELFESEKRFQDIINFTTVVIYIKDLDGRYLLINSSFEKLFNITNDEIRGKTDYDLFPKNVADNLKINDNKVKESKEILNIEEIIPQDDGQHFYKSIKFQLTNSSNEIYAICGMSTDITNEKNSYNKLELANKQADIASKAKSDFLANMSHEIRTPLNGVIGITDLLLKTTIDNKQNSYIHTIKNSGKLLLSIINDILDFSKIEAGKLEIENLDFDLTDMMIKFLNLTFSRVNNKELEYSCTIDPKIPKLLIGDSNRITQILTNLVGNAIKFTSKGSIIINCTLEKENKDSIELKFEINDTGIGIPKEKQKKLFDKFTQADSSTTREFGGTGLGLAICKQLTKLMGGSIGVISPSIINNLENNDESNEIIGSTFWFTLELKRSTKNLFEFQKLQSLNSRNSINNKKKNTSFDLKHTILLVEDNATNRFIAKELLNEIELEFDIIEAENGLEAIKRLENPGIDLVLMDVQMPIMDGLTATKKIRDDDSGAINNKIPIIAMTANAMKGDREMCLEAGMDDYIAKPVSLNSLSNILKKCLKLTSDSKNNSGFDSKEDTELISENEDFNDSDESSILFDKNKLKNMFKNKSDKIKKIYNSFLEETPEEINELKKGIENDNFEVIIRMAHTIKGSSSNVGGISLQNISYEIEQAGKEEDISLLKIKLPILENEYEVLKKEITNEIVER